MELRLLRTFDGRSCGLGLASLALQLGGSRLDDNLRLKLAINPCRPWLFLRRDLRLVGEAACLLGRDFYLDDRGNYLDGRNRIDDRGNYLDGRRTRLDGRGDCFLDHWRQRRTIDCGARSLGQGQKQPRLWQIPTQDGLA